jgi:hypothetical protein
LLAARLFWTFRGDLRTWGSSSSSDSSAVSGLSDTTAFAFLLRGAGVAAVGSREGVSGGGGGALHGVATLAFGTQRVYQAEEVLYVKEPFYGDEAL